MEWQRGVGAAARPMHYSVAARVLRMAIVASMFGVAASPGEAAAAWLEQPEPAVNTVHVINSCHLDIGFADTSLAIVNDYFDKHL